MTSHGVVLVFTGGDAPSAELISSLPAHDLVIAADSGADHALTAGIRVDLVVGDLDSASPAALSTAEGDGAVVEPHPAEKDHTDLDLALIRALQGGPQRIVIVGGGGGRLDHLLGNLTLMASPGFADIQLEARMGTARVQVVRPGRITLLDGSPGSLVSLFAVGGRATGITTDGLRYALRDEPLEPGSSRGVSNELVARAGSVTLTEGVLLAVQPEVDWSTLSA